ncbi:MAG: hypothetical protein O3B84_07745 [Chloroflexi bacterium]|nr:hypothetical protein [Chloroflexota bacterium]
MGNAVAATIRAELGRDEELLWSGQPRRGIVFRPLDLMLVPFSLLWTGFIVYWEFLVFDLDAPLFSLFGIPFLIVGSYMVAGRFVADVMRRRRTFYGLTSQRIIIVFGQSVGSVKSFPLGALSDISLSVGRGATGTVAFGPMGAAWSAMSAVPLPGLQLLSSFEMIPDARTVYQLILGALRETPRN